jgi:glycosyltransferase involved in cell wall biosynthesis
MAVAAAEHLALSYDLDIAVLRGPLRQRFEAYGRTLRASPTMSLEWQSPTRWLVDVGRSILDGVRIAIHVRRRGISAVYTNSCVLLGPVIGARLAGVPAVVHARELPADRSGRFLFAVLGTLADTVVAISGPVQNAFAGARRATVARIPDGIIIPPSSGEQRRAFQSPARLCLIGTVGGDGRKGQDIAIAALARLAAEGVRARLKLVGPITDPASAQAIADCARTLGVQDEVELTGVSDQIEEIIAGSDIVISCARQEPLGLTVIEALAQETPVVASRVGGVPEIIRDGETGVLVAPEDPEAVASAIASLLAAPGEARAMARRGRADVAARFDRAGCLAALEVEIARHARA